MTTQAVLEEARHCFHPHCVVCGSDHPQALCLSFRVLEDGSVAAVFDCAKRFEGYPEVLHGGVVAALLDGAMTNCLFAHGIVAVTAELVVRYCRPVAIGCEASIRAWITRSAHRCHVLRAELQQEGEVAATGEAKFLEAQPWRPGAARGSGGQPMNPGGETRGV